MWLLVFSLTGWTSVMKVWWGVKYVFFKKQSFHKVPFLAYILHRMCTLSIWIFLYSPGYKNRYSQFNTLTESHFSSTPLEKMYKDGRIQNSCCQIIHYSDTLRLAILHRCEEETTLLLSPMSTRSLIRPNYFIGA